MTGRGRTPAPDRRRLERQIRLSRLALLWERLWPALRWTMATLGAFAVASLLGLWEAAPLWLHAALLAGFAAALAAALWSARGAARPPERAAAVRRLERESGLPHRPLSAQFDSPAGAAGAARDALWRAHRDRAARLLGRLRVGWPRASLAAHDPWALRGLLALAAAVSLAFAGDRAGQRFAAAFAFDKPGAEAPPGRLTAWVDPPEHTGLAPIFLTPPGGVAPGAPAPEGAHDVIAGSVLHARVLGGAAAPMLATGAAEQNFAAAGENNYALRRALDSDVQARVVQDGRALGAWRFSVAPDAPPEAELAGPPESTRRGVLRLGYRAADDFGLDEISVHIRRDGGGDAWPIDFSLPLPGLAPTEAEEWSYRDLTAHPWAGLDAVLELTAVDNAGQRGRAEPLAFALPERPFAHPVAVEIVARRRALALDAGAAAEVAEALAALLAEPEAFAGDAVAFLGLAAARTRLEHTARRLDRRSVIDLLWDVALRIEDGALSLAERALREAQEDLREALREGAAPEELAGLMDRLQEALDEYLDRLAESGREAEELDDGETAALDPDSLRRGRDDLQRMIQDARDLAETGARDAAQQLLQRLQELLENMEPARPERNPQTAGGDPMRELREIMEDQQELLEETWRRAARQEGENERLTEAGEPTAAERQEALRRALGEFMRRLGEAGGDIPEPLGRAERRMRDAGEELARERPDRAADAQARALGELQRGAEMAMNEMLAGRSGQRPGRDGARRDEVRDPFGRLPPGEGGDPGGFVEVPTRSAVQRSREIRDELRRRAGERSRARVDLDYIDRLLDMY